MTALGLVRVALQARWMPGGARNSACCKTINTTTTYSQPFTSATTTTTNLCRYVCNMYVLYRCMTHRRCVGLVIRSKRKQLHVSKSPWNVLCFKYLQRNAFRNHVCLLRFFACRSFVCPPPPPPPRLPHHLERTRVLEDCMLSRYIGKQRHRTRKREGGVGWTWPA